jgi:hypothetical protein
MTRFGLGPRKPSRARGRGAPRVVSTVAFGLVLLASASATEAEANSKASLIPLPWFTGPILAPSATTVPPGQVNLEPYLFVTDQVGHYNNKWALQSEAPATSVNAQWLIEPGVTDFMDIKAVPQMFYNFHKGAYSAGFGDLPVRLGLELLEENHQSWEPAIKLFLGESFPTGEYQHLKASKKTTDSTGGGSFVSELQLMSQKYFHIYDTHFVRLRGFFSYDMSRPVHVSGLNTYGGGEDTDGVVKLGNVYTGILAFEYNFTRNWVIAMDAQYQYAGKRTFSGDPGTNPNGTPASLSSDQVKVFSLAPAFEYNFSAELGLLAGVWFSVIGQNTGDFISPTVAVNYFN